ncbi:hypothetical protein [Candidatus Berkiella aquae]|uniref:Uncharacterized protein n=1 Tax=Candidatus Berkiella aquae TaxID=295108 RepID=A0A0Q9YJI3_9GAMM|nr:hypothetical protein [Candidatus Berkiella aquae]MCS5710675.1 hypothetical protein [Candidatus Berkiella aquae]
MKPGPKQRVATEQACKKPKLNANDEAVVATVLAIQELRETIFNYLPLYRSMGENKLAAVCKQWSKPLRKEDFSKPAVFQSILEDCQNSLETIQFILKDKVLLSLIDFAQVLEICSCNAKLAMRLLNNQAIANRLSGDLLVILTKYHNEVASCLLEKTELHCKLTSTHIVELSVKDRAFSACFVALACFDPFTNYHRFHDDFEIYGDPVGLVHENDKQQLIELIVDEATKSNEVNAEVKKRKRIN